MIGSKKILGQYKRLNIFIFDVCMFNSQYYLAREVVENKAEM